MLRRQGRTPRTPLLRCFDVPRLARLHLPHGLAAGDLRWSTAIEAASKWLEFVEGFMGKNT